jgi:hypothetical protein
MFFKKPEKPQTVEKPKMILTSPPPGYVIVCDGSSIKIHQAIVKALRWDHEGEIDWSSVRQAWRDAFAILKTASIDELERIGIEMENIPDSKAQEGGDGSGK